MYAAIVFFPLLGFLIAGIFGRQIGARPAELVTTSLLFISAALSWIVFAEVALRQRAGQRPGARQLVHLGRAQGRLGAAHRHASPR